MFLSTLGAVIERSEPILAKINAQSGAAEPMPDGLTRAGRRLAAARRARMVHPERAPGFILGQFDRIAEVERFRRPLSLIHH